MANDLPHDLIAELDGLAAEDRGAVLALLDEFERGAVNAALDGRSAYASVQVAVHSPWMQEILVGTNALVTPVARAALSPGLLPVDFPAVTAPKRSLFDVGQTRVALPQQQRT